MPVRGAKSVRRMAERNASRIPDKLNTLLNKWEDDIQSLRTAGILYASEQIADLVAHGVEEVKCRSVLTRHHAPYLAQCGTVVPRYARLTHIAARRISMRRAAR